MQYKKPEYCAMIEDYINSFRNRQGSTPSLRQIASGVGLAVGTVSKYLSYMRENGVLDYDGHRSVTTRKTRGLMNMLYVPLLGAVSCGVPKFAEENIEEYVCLPESLFGNQKAFLERYARQEKLTNIRHYIDDDESGRFFDRSAYVRMMDDVESGKIGIVVMKDMTRCPKAYR